MKPFQKLAQVQSPDGSFISLHEHDGEYYVKHNGRQLMSTIATVSEQVLADVGCGFLRNVPAPRVLIGGLGLGFTLKRVLEIVGPKAVVHVSELLPEVVQWNREFLKRVNGLLLDDPRVEVLTCDVFEVLRKAGRDPYDSILLDVDHTPASWVQVKNARLYDRSSFGVVRRALRPRGLVAYWSAGEEPDFVNRFSRSGFRVQTHEARAYPTARRAVHRIYVGSVLPKPTPEEAPKASAHQPAKRSSTPKPQPSSSPKASRFSKPKKDLHPFKTPAQFAGLQREERRRHEAKAGGKRPQR